MADQDMRLRLVVRRNGLPELRLMWHVQSDSNPTISKLLEQLNEQVPLESDHWGLEDYVVELHDGDGTDFECLHYQLVRSVLKPDDRVFIRALDRDDHHRRRISGRHQISSDGRHLIDGIPFGRPRLRTGTTRPNIYIPPLKRARLAYTQHDANHHAGDLVAENEAPLLLTNGELYGDMDDTDSDADDPDFMNDDAQSNTSTDGSSIAGGEREEDFEGDQEAEEEGIDEDEYGDMEEEQDQDIDQELQELAIDNAMLEEGQPSQVLGLDTLDKLTALRTVFPTAPIDICENVLAACYGDLKTTYNVLSEPFTPQMTQEAALAWRPGNRNPCTDLGQASNGTTLTATQPSGAAPATKKRKFQGQSPSDDSENDEYDNPNNTLWRKYDHAGFPPGTITSGKGLAHMAAISASFDKSKTPLITETSEATSTTLKASTVEPTGKEERDDTSSSEDSSDSDSSTSSDESEDEEVSRDENSSSESDAADSDDMGLDDSSDSSDDSSSDASSSESDESDSDSAPEEHSSKVIDRINLTTRDEGSINSSESSDDASSDSSDDSSADSLDESSDNESSGSDSSSESEDEASDEQSKFEALGTKIIEATCTAPQLPDSSSNRTKTDQATIPVPPGAGKESTKRRNARRRAAKLAKRKMQESSNDDARAAAPGHISSRQVEAGINNQAALFEAKRKALLDALANGGIEIGSSGETILDHCSVAADRANRKHAKDVETSSQHDQNGDHVEPTEKSPVDDQAESTQKKRRIDLGAGRRLVFGALGLRNPKNKDDEDKLRDRLRADAQQHANRYLSSQSQPAADEVENMDEEQDPDAWKLKINYRAVECCQDNTELSPAPFPFRQRWDPQQQYTLASKRGKRGGKSKQAQRNQDHFYEDNQLGKKRKRHNSSELLGTENDQSYSGENNTTDGFDVTLNYDDAESPAHSHENNVVNGTSQATDLDDLPSVPQDVSVLPSLRPGEAQVGMVIAWLKWTCSSATGWQPQLSRVAAIVAKVDDDAATLKVCLAKRDRHLNANEKRYDHTTGQRIYDRFEAPDLDEEGEENDDYEDGVDEGYCDISWADMKDPRILQQPLTRTVEFDPNAGHDEETASAKDQPTPSQASLVTDHQDTDPIVNPENPTDLNPMQIISEVGSHVIDIRNSASSPSEERQNEESVERYAQVASNSTSHHDGQNQQSADMSMSDNSQISSPSRQLHETASQAMSSNSPPRSWIPASSVELGESPPADPSSSIPLPAPVLFQSHREEDIESDIIAATMSSVQHQIVVPSSTSSIHSGRQPDYDMDVNNQVSDPLDVVDDVDKQSYDDDQFTPSPDCSSLTPMPSRRTATPDPANNIAEDEVQKSSPFVSPSSRSLSSLSSLWCTAPTSHNTQSPSKARDSPLISKSSKSRITRDANYEEAMRKLDAQLDEGSLPIAASSSIEVKRENLTQFRNNRSLDAISPPPRRKPFTIPPGSQVVELSSDSEPAYTEHYADDEIDETYSPESERLPTGDGWVKKHRDVERQKTRNRSAF
ncbi:hypothetical protein F5B22DRAFT_650903 [Xylaria bambusicola]|uniref:uncharacterized protein n=1 Tax=Xylaria bambusicola TaxID=326684 RepID=UPI002008C63D|nr:uncharacterized protein F5B22DRAFT_650903 [Xylaria bambusicola]KAI0506343.1 hypothetical protein F5B22DRAFT_650903 [Xylaria bambusicola]